MSISKKNYATFFAGFSISDCVVRNRNTFHFMTRNIKESVEASVISEGDVTKRMVAYFIDREEGKQFGSRTFEGYQKFFIGASQRNEDKAVCVSVSGEITASGGGKIENESAIPVHKEGPRRGAIQRIRMIQGMLYAVGTGNTVCRRRGRNDWESLCFNLPKEKAGDFENVERSEAMAIEDIDGFSDTDLYIIAGKGQVWNFNGEKWSLIPFPSNMYLHSICCAGDGYVYIGAQSGTVFRGRKNEWKLLSRGDMTLPFNDIVWHAGKVWCTSDYGLWQIDGERIVKSELPSSEIVVCAGNLSVADGVMLMAGSHGAAFHDGKTWQLIFNSAQFEK
jgi:hypothetical protein